MVNFFRFLGSSYAVLGSYVLRETYVHTVLLYGIMYSIIIPEYKVFDITSSRQNAPCCSLALARKYDVTCLVLNVRWFHVERNCLKYCLNDGGMKLPIINNFFFQIIL